MTPFQTLRGIDILVTGHTGFTGTWACHLLYMLGARVHGFSLPPPTSPAMFDLTKAQETLQSHTIGDITDPDALQACFRLSRPRLVLHLAAQPLVLQSYSDPVGTFLTNTQGTLNVLEAARSTPEVQGVVCITTDKVYANGGERRPFIETDPLGGKDPYSASKAAAEMAITSYRQLLAADGRDMSIEVARGGNIIGGGDWAKDRIIPDLARAISVREPLQVRNLNAVRPWQHVLALLHGYLTLLDRIARGESHGGEAWNFGPADETPITVGQLLLTLMNQWTTVPIEVQHVQVKFQREEFHLLINSEKARSILSWQPAWSNVRATLETASWYRSSNTGKSNLLSLTQRQIQDYFKL